MKQNRPIARLLGAVFSFLTLLGLTVAILALVSDEVLPPEWNPYVPLRVDDPVTPVTKWKLTAALSGPQECLAALNTQADFSRLPDFEESAQCHIRTQVALRGVANTQISELKTRCQTALRMAMWVTHGIQPAAQAHLNQSAARLHHLSSYNCRQIRTTGGNAGRMSTHATAEAVDITGVTLADGRRLNLLESWNSDDPAIASFMREIRDSACVWFRTTLGPDFNRLHADHFHLQHTGWGTCR